MKLISIGREEETTTRLFGLFLDPLSPLSMERAIMRRQKMTLIHRQFHEKSFFP